MHDIPGFEDSTKTDGSNPTVDDETTKCFTEKQVKIALTGLQGAVSPDASASSVVE